MLFYLLEKLRYYDDYVKEDRYTEDTLFTHFEERFYELNGKTLAPLNRFTENLIDKTAFSKMKKSCIFLNLGRGSIVVEQALYDALENDLVKAAGLDVLCEEPMTPENPLRHIKDSRRLFITPHIGWASVEARNRLMAVILEQVREFFEAAEI